MKVVLGKIKKAVSSYRKLVEKKPYIEFLTAILSVPVLISIILVNVSSLKSEKTPTPTPSPEVKEKNIYIPVTSTEKNRTSGTSTDLKATSAPNAGCKPGIGPVSISSPDEGDTVTSNPVSITINYETGEYCAAVWSYSINGGSWSAYDDTSIALYNLPSGKIKVDVRVKSIVNGDVKTLTRNFTYKSSNGSAIEPSITSEVKGASASAN